MKLTNFRMWFQGPYDEDMYNVMRPRDPALIIGKGISAGQASASAVSYVRSRGFGPVASEIEAKVQENLPPEPHTMEAIEPFLNVYCFIKVEVDG